MTTTTPNERLKEYIYTVSRSINQFAKKIGMVPSAISRVTSGDVSLTPGMAARILTACPDLSEEWLMEGTGPMTRPASVTVNVSDHARGAAHDYHEHHPAPTSQALDRFTSTLDELAASLQTITRLLDTISRLLDTISQTLASQSQTLASQSSTIQSQADTISSLLTRLP